MAIAMPLPAASFSDGCCPPDLFLCCAPCLLMIQFAPVKTVAPRRKPIAVAATPPVSSASSISSNDSAEISTRCRKPSRRQSAFVAHG